MALHTKKDFAELCGMPSSRLAIYVQRGKVVYSGDYVDDALEVNRAFLDKMVAKQGLMEPTKSPAKSKPGPRKKDVKPSVKAPAKPNTTSENKGSPPSNLDQASLLELDKEKKALDIRKTAEQIEILKVKKEQLHGELIPTELVKALITTQSESQKIAFNEATENLIVIMSQKKEFSSAEVADIRSQLVLIINRAIDNSINESKKRLVNIVKEYSEKKGVGERNDAA